MGSIDRRDGCGDIRERGSFIDAVAHESIRAGLSAGGGYGWPHHGRDRSPVCHQPSNGVFPLPAHRGHESDYGHGHPHDG